jgi:D-beta-D-heptose 7-phosphate kinase/D-beta-D-heptose 1-phosphate adenosyltransferase
MKIVIVTGGFDPIHSGHLEYLNHAKKLGNRLIVGVNSDDWLIRKKGRAFMPFAERRNILHNIRINERLYAIQTYKILQQERMVMMQNL